MTRRSPCEFLISVTAHCPGLLLALQPCTVYSRPSRIFTVHPPCPFQEIREPRNSLGSLTSRKTPSAYPVPGDVRAYLTCEPLASTNATHENCLTSPMMNMS